MTPLVVLALLLLPLLVVMTTGVIHLGSTWPSLLSLSFFLPPCLICRLEFTHYDRYHHHHLPTTLTF